MDENLPACVRYWLSEANHDCFFVVGPEDGTTERIGAIKVLLMGHSEPLRAMLQDSALSEKGDIRVKDVEPDTFTNFLKCVYGASGILIPTFTFEESAKLLYVAEKYLVNDVKNELIKHMEDIFSITEIYCALSHKICHEVTSLKIRMLKVLRYNFDRLTEDDQFLQLNDIAIGFILRLNFLPVKEIEVWNALLKWAKHKTGSTDGQILRAHIFKFFKCIRFLTMDFKDFNEHVLTSGILLEDEVNDIYKAFVSGKPCTIEHLCSSRNNRYNVKPVCEQIIFETVSNPKYAIIQFTVSSVSSIQPSCHRTSNTFNWCELYFYISARRDTINEIDYLGVLLGCVAKKSNWSCNVEVEISLINQLGNPDKAIVFNPAETFSESSGRVWGRRNFYSWNDLLKEDNGFVKDDSIILVAKIQLKN